MYLIQCKNCGKYFEAKNPRAETCSQNCRTAYHYRKKFGEKMLNVQQVFNSVERSNTAYLSHNSFNETVERKDSVEQEIAIQINRNEQALSDKSNFVFPIAKREYFVKPVNMLLIEDFFVQDIDLDYWQLPQTFNINNKTYLKTGYLPTYELSILSCLNEFEEYFTAIAQLENRKVVVLYITQQALSELFDTDECFFYEIEFTFNDKMKAVLADFIACED